MLTREQARRRFHEIGARVVMNPWDPEADSFFRIQLTRTHRREQFEIRVSGRVALDIPDVDADLRQLLLLARWEDARAGRFVENATLCGFDERHWFAAALPLSEKAAIRTIADAHEALKPPAVRESQARLGVRGPLRNSRKNPGFIRQGEWFFIPRPELSLDLHQAVRNGELSRGFGRPHIVQYLTGDTDRFSWRRGWGPRNKPVYARGWVRHRDHRSIHLPIWHEVEPNEEVGLPGGGFGGD